MNGRKKILVVEDEDYIRLLLMQTLERLADYGVDLLQASDGQTGLALALKEQPDLAFLDVMMPNLDGFQVCQQIKAANSRTHVILLTACGESIDKHHGMQVNADGYITKPFDPDLIFGRAVEILHLEVATATESDKMERDEP